MCNINVHLMTLFKHTHATEILVSALERHMSLGGIYGEDIESLV